MAKETIKREVLEVQESVCALTEVPLPNEFCLYDTDRIQEKMNGGIYTLANTRLVNPVAHLKRHDNLRLRSEMLDALKSLVDDRNHKIKIKVKASNQLLAYKRSVDNLRQDTIDWLEALVKDADKQIRAMDKEVTKFISNHAENLPPAVPALGLRGVGPITVAYCAVYIDLEKARHASSLWKYVGLHTASHSRYKKGEAGGGNKTLRTILYTMADSQVKSRGVYREIYDQIKTRLSQSEKLVWTRTTQGHLVELPWKDTKPSHRHGAAMRAIMKHFLADYWYAGREMMGLDVSPLYPEAILGGSHRTIMPKERGWEY